MGLLELSKFKLQLRTLITEVQELREREHSATEQLRLLIQKQKQTEEEHGRTLQEVQTELALSKELRQKLQRKVNRLQDDNALLENKQKELNGTIQSLLQSRDSFVNAYEESTCEMKRSIQTRDRKLAVLSEKIKSHLLLFDSIEKEAHSIKQVVNDVQCFMSEKEEVVAGLKSKMDKVSAFEKVFVEKISDLEYKLKKNEDELQRKDRMILELEAHLEAARSCNNNQNQIEELQKTLSGKDVIIQNLISEKEELHGEVGCLSIILQKIQDTVTTMNEEDQRVFSSIVECQERRDTVMSEEVKWTEDVPQSNMEKCPNKASETACKGNTASLLCEEYKKVAGPLGDHKNNDSCVSESSCSESQSGANDTSISIYNGQPCLRSVQHLDSECSTTQAEPLKKQSLIKCQDNGLQECGGAWILSLGPMTSKKDAQRVKD